MSNIKDILDELQLLINVPKTIIAAKNLAAAGVYAAADVMSELVSGGTAYHFQGMTGVGRAGGVIEKAIALCSTTALTQRMTLFLFNAPPACVLNDNAANTAVVVADTNACQGWIDLPAMEDLGTGQSGTLATPSTAGNLPLVYHCGGGANSDLYGVLVTRDATTAQAAGMKMTIILQIRQD